MKVAYVLKSPMASVYELATMILPQLENGIHGAQVVGMMFFDDNVFVLRKGDPIGERLAKVAREQGILIMACDQCALRRNMAEGTFTMCGTGSVQPKDMIEGATVGCFPQLYAALAGNPPDYVISL